MDFLQTIFKTNIFLLRILEIYPEIHANTKPVLRILILTKSEAKKLQKFTQIKAIY